MLGGCVISPGFPFISMVFLTLSAIQAASQSTFINAQLLYTPLISGNDKNKQITLLSQRKLALTARNTLFAV
jgi:hypothetical protein